MRLGRALGGEMVCNFKMKYSKLKISKTIEAKSCLPAVGFKVAQYVFLYLKWIFCIEKQYDFRIR